MLRRLEADDTDSDHDPVVVLLGLPRIAVKELVVSSKGKALELESVEDVEREKDGKVLPSHLFRVIGQHVHPVDGVDSEAENGEVLKESLEAFIVRLLHESNQDVVLEKPVALLALRVLDISPVTAGVFI